jgi:NADH dehydrogenase FAD-containing subunit
MMFYGPFSGDYTKPKPKVVILGGGFGGLYTALRLAQLAKPHPNALPSFDITLVDR